MFATVRRTLDSEKLPKNPILRFLALLFLVPATLLVMPLYELGKSLSKEAYRGWVRGIFNGLFGFALGLGAAVLTSGHIGWTMGWSIFAWFPAGIVAFLLTFNIIWPAAFLYVVDPVYRGLEKFFKFTNRCAKDLGKPLCDTTIELLSALPGSGKLWAYVEDKDKGSQWVKSVMVFLTGAGVLGLGVWGAIAVHALLLPLVPAVGSAVTPAVASWMAGGVIGLVLAVLLFQLLEHGDLHFAAVALTASGVYTALPLSTAAVSALGLPVWATYIACVLEFGLGLAYVYPAVHGLLKSGLIKTLLEGVRWMLENTYDEKDSEYRTFYGNLAALVAAAALGMVALFGVSVFAVLPGYAVYTAAILVFLAAWVALGELFDSDAGAVATGLAGAAAAGYGIYSTFHGAWQGVVFWPALAGGVVLTFTLGVPVLYSLLRLITRSWLSTPAGKGLDWLHEQTEKAARSVSDWWDKHVIRRSYDDTTAYRELFAHGTNLTLVGLAIWQAWPRLAAWAAAPGIKTIALLAGFAFLGFITYLLLAKVLKGIGASALGFAAGIAAALYAGYNLYLLNEAYWWVAALIGLTAGSVVTWVLFPVAYIIVKLPADLLLTPWLRPVLVGIYNFFWSGFEGIWNVFVSVYMVVHRTVFAPVIAWVGGMLKTAREIWDSILGRNKAG